MRAVRFRCSCGPRAVVVRLAQTLGRIFEPAPHANGNEYISARARQFPHWSAKSARFWQGQRSKARQGTHGGPSKRRGGCGHHQEHRPGSCFLACGSCQLANAALSCGWLALRAGVLRRAVSSSVRPLLHRGTCSVSVGHMPLRSSPWAKASSSCAVVLPACLAIAVQVGSRPQMRPNRSLNRTHCGMRPKARHFILGF